MGTRENPGAFDCYANALPDEPMFVLLARDPVAPAIVREWADARALVDGRIEGSPDLAMILEARNCADAMETWRKEKDGAWRDREAAPLSLSCPGCADRRDRAERVLRIIERNQIRDFEAMEMLDGLVRDAGAGNSRLAIKRLDDDAVPF